jgi:hypothetical protein
VPEANPKEPIRRPLTHSIRLPDLVRVGSESDGGYVVPRSFAAACDGILGLGVHADWSFEQEALALAGARHAHLYDATTTIPWLVSRMPMGVLRLIGGALSAQPRRMRDGVNRLTAPFRYARFFRGGVRHYPEMIGHRAEPRWVDPATAVARLREAGATRILLKMDIEGGEYEVLPRIDEWGGSVDLLLVEFHGIQDDPARFNALMRTIARLFVPVHLHGNNSQPLTPDGFPGMVEITFLARRLAPAGVEPQPFSYPIPALDRRSSLRGPELSFTA